MQALIPTTATADGELAVSARDLHSFFQVAKRLNVWFDTQIQYGFKEELNCLEAVWINRFGPKGRAWVAVGVTFSPRSEAGRRSDTRLKSARFGGPMVSNQNALLSRSNR